MLAEKACRKATRRSIQAVESKRYFSPVCEIESRRSLPVLHFAFGRMMPRISIGLTPFSRGHVMPRVYHGRQECRMIL